MRRLAATARALVSTVALGGLATLPALAELKWDAQEAAIRVPADQSSAKAAFGFVNAGDRPITITNVHPGCGCTVPALAKSNYAPGERGEIGIDFHVGNREGLNRIPITVTTDDGATATLQFVADIEPLAAFDTRFVYWKGAETRAPKRMRVTFAAGQGATIAEARSSNPQFTVAVAPVGDTGREFEVVVTPPDKETNYTAITLRVQLGAAREARDFTVVARTM